MQRAPGDLRRTAQRLRTGLMVAMILVVLFGVIATAFFIDLETIGPCNGGLGFGATTCPSSPPAFLTEQLGYSHLENGTHVCSVIIYSPSPEVPYSTALTIWAQTPSGTRLNLTSMALYSSSGSLLANYSVSGSNWTTHSRVGIFEPDVLTITSVTSLIGQQVVIWDPGSGFGDYQPIR